MIPRKLLLSYLIVALLHLVAKGEENSFEVISTNIAPQSENTSVLRDTYGFLWVGSRSGLFCYDGNGESVYGNRSATLKEINGKDITTLFQLGENLLIGTTDGLYIFDRKENRIKKFSQKTEYGVPISAEVKKIHQANNGNIWIATMGQGLFVYNPSTQTLEQNSRDGSFYTDIAEGADGLIYTALIRGKINAFNPQGQLVKSYAIPGMANSKQEILLSSSGSKIWFAKGAALYQLDMNKGTIDAQSLPGLKGVINTIIRRANGSLLLSTEQGIWNFNTITGQLSSIHQLKYQPPLHTSRIKLIQEDVDGNIFLLYFNKPLDLMITKDAAVSFIPLPDPDSDGMGYMVNALTYSPAKDALCIGSERGITFYNYKTKEYDSFRSILPAGLNITDIEAVNKKVYVATHDNGIFIIDPATSSFKQYTYDENIPYSLISNNVNSIGVTSRGEIIILTDWGVCRYNPEEDNFPQLTEFDQKTQALDFHVDARKGEWIATSNNGLFYRGDGEDRFQRAYWSQSKGDLPVISMTLDAEGNLWVITEREGVYIYNYDTREFNKLQLPLQEDDTLSFITSDSSGEIWIGTNRMLIQADPNGVNHRYFNFSRHAAHLPVVNSVATLPGDIIVIGALNGFLAFEPSKLMPYKSKAKVYPLSLSLPFIENDTEELEAQGLNKLLYTTSGIELPFKDNTFTLRFAASRPFIESDVKYDYMLKGLDKSWNLASVVPEVTYNNLPSGKYEFLLRPSGDTSSKPVSLKINVLPPWYLTGWAYIVYVIIIIAALWGAYYVAKILTRNNFKKRLEALQLIQERETFEAKTKYFVDLVHEIRTPLMLISLPLEQLSEDIRDPEKEDCLDPTKTGIYVKSMKQNLDYLLGITNQLLDFRKAEKNSEIHLNLSRCNIKNMLSEICRRFDEPLKVQNKEIILNLPTQEVTAVIDADKIDRLLMNLLGNAMKYCRSVVTATLSVSNEEEVTIEIGDDGQGIPMEERPHIFDAYYQIGKDRIAATLGTGLGLAYARLIANTHKGSIEVGETPEGGALFTLTFPMGDPESMTNTRDIMEFDSSAEEKEDEFDKDITVLLVEDNADLREMITKALGKNYNVVTAPDGEDALEILKDNPIDVIVSDVMMERMNGMELCRRVKTDINYSHIPVILLTAMTGEQAHEEGLSSGADVYLEKPFPIKQLILQINNLLRTRTVFREYLNNNAGSNQPIEEKSPSGKKLNKMDLEFIEKMNNKIMESIEDETLSIDSLAQSMNMSRSSFYRKITSVAGVSPNEYLKNFRLNHAARLLRDGCRVSEVSLSVGFTSSSYFAKCFKDKFNVLPSDYVDSL